MAETIDAALVRERVAMALHAARTTPLTATIPRVLHAARSREFVQALGTALASLYEHDADVACFTKHDATRRKEFGTNELLYDITVCRTATVPSARAGKHLYYVSAPLWHVESELAEDSREALYDFNKLVLGAAPYNLFVGPLVTDPAAFIDVLRPPASSCAGRVFVALIPHPRDWDSGLAATRCEELP